METEILDKTNHEEVINGLRRILEYLDRKLEEEQAKGLNSNYKLTYSNQ
ncbi:MAG: hypothetical protein PHW73_10175 [Atribacterota bacterium]|nr:hypothetical protein [Atribacterota bacterium]